MIKASACLLIASVMLAACSDESSDNPSPSQPDIEGDGASEDGVDTDGTSGEDSGGEQCESLTSVVMAFGASCASNGACHAAGGQYPDLSYAGLPALINAPSARMSSALLVVPGDPEASWIYRKVTGTQGADGGLLMPIGSAEPIDGAEAIAEWIRAGAPTQCDKVEPPVTPIPDPNALNQDALFTCTGNTPASSPARIRRLNRATWTHSAGESLRATAYQNAFHAPDGRYSTFSDGVTIDPSTLDLYFQVLPEVSDMWAIRSWDVWPHLYLAFDDPSDTVHCMYQEEIPSDACIDGYLQTMLSKGVLFRSPSEGEFSRVRALLTAELEAERASGGTVSRQDTLRQVTASAWLMSGALFRPELGDPATVDVSGRLRLTHDELALSLGNVLSTHPPGSSSQTGWDFPEDPKLGWLGQIRAAADDGSIQDPAVLRQLLQQYRGGIDFERHDILFDSDERDIPARGEYWLAPQIASFFREWLDYGEANSKFKDTPLATSEWENLFTAKVSWSNLQTSFYGYESTFVAQLDDTIARAVLESEANGEDVFRTLMTTRLWRLPSNLIFSNGTACTPPVDGEPDPCKVEFGDPWVCPEITNVCSGTSSKNTVSMNLIYGVTENVPATPEGRWVVVPEGERSGVLTHPAWLIAHGGNFEDDASAIYRGHWIREHLYCETVPGLDLVQVDAQLIPSDPTLRARDRIRVSIEEGPQAATCMGCHAKMNSLGMPFETFNHAGLVRLSDHGQTPSGYTVIDNAPHPSLNGEVDDVIALTELFASSPHARRCFIRHVFRYFMGRDETMADACTLSAMESAFGNGSFFNMLEALVTSDTFLYRHVDGGTP